MFFYLNWILFDPQRAKSSNFSHRNETVAPSVTRQGGQFLALRRHQAAALLLLFEDDGHDEEEQEERGERDR